MNFSSFLFLLFVAVSMIDVPQTNAVPTFRSRVKSVRQKLREKVKGTEMPNLYHTYMKVDLENPRLGPLPPPPRIQKSVSEMLAK